MFSLKEGTSPLELCVPVAQGQPVLPSTGTGHVKDHLEVACLFLVLGGLGGA